MTNFSDLGLPESILTALNNINFTTPTPIQEQAIPVAMEGHDILGSAQTGTGKTAAFTIPMIKHLMENQTSMALVLLPTRELAQQVQDSCNLMLGKNNEIKSVLLIGGEAMPRQLQQLKRNPRIIIGTPGRINDHLLRRTLKLRGTDFLVLDETDRMLDMGFGIQLDQIVKFLPAERQTLMFSATLPDNILNLARKYQKSPVRIAIGSANAVATNIKQELIKTTDASKYDELLKQINERAGSMLIFVKTKFGAERLSIKLSKESEKCSAIHGDLRQAKREKVIADFRQQKYRILVATDIAARGLDIPHIESVVNYDLPQCPEDYIHRIGRTARAGASGCAINLLTPKDAGKWKDIYKLLNPSSRDKKMLIEGDAPVNAEPLAGGKAAPRKARSANGKNPFKPYAPDKKAKSRAKFNKNSRNADGFAKASPVAALGMAAKPRANNFRRNRNNAA